MRVELKKSWSNWFRKYPVGTILQVDRKLFNELINSGHVEYKGDYPPKEKKKIELFNL